MKKKIIVGVLGLFTLLLVTTGIYYFVSIKPVNKKDNNIITFVIKSGEKKTEIAKNLKDSGLIKSDKAAVIYMFFNSDLNIQAGEYDLSKSMSLSQMLNKFDKGEVRIKNIKITFLPGKRLLDYVAIISDEFGYSEEEIINTINGSDFLSTMIDKYWFLTDEILNDKIYYGLEGYIMPDTYEFMSDASIEEIFIRLLDYTSIKLEKYKTQISTSNHSLHEILTMASIVELEANTESDRRSVAQVINKRLELDISLGMDVTTYYAEQKQMGEDLTTDELYKGNAYNTRNTNMLGLPIGPIGNPSEMSINAVFNPSNTNYLYFYADVQTGKVYFANTNDEFLKIVKEVG